MTKKKKAPAVNPGGIHTPFNADDPGNMHTGTGLYPPSPTQPIWEHDDSMEAYKKAFNIKSDDSKLIKKTTKRKSGK